jgi:hypothetical protein
MSASNSGEDPNKGPNKGPGKGKSTYQTLARIAADQAFRKKIQNQMFPDEEVGQGVKRKSIEKLNLPSEKKTKPLDELLDEAHTLNEKNLFEDLGDEGGDDPHFVEAIEMIDLRDNLIQELQAKIRELEEAQKQGQGQDNQNQIEILRGTLKDQETRYQEEYIRLQSIQSEMQNTIRAFEENQHKTTYENQQLLQLRYNLEHLNQTLSHENKTLKDQISILESQLQDEFDEKKDLLDQISKLKKNNKMNETEKNNLLAQLTSVNNEHDDRIEEIRSEMSKIQNSLLEEQRAKSDIVGISASAHETLQILKPQLEECNKKLKDCEEEKTELTKNLKKCEDSKLSSRPGSSLAEGPRQGQGPSNSILQSLAEEQGIEIEPFMFYDVYYNADRNEFYTKETGVVDIEYAKYFINYKEKEFLFEQEKIYQKAAKKKQQRGQVVEGVKESKIELVPKEFLTILNEKNRMLLDMQDKTKIFLEDIRQIQQERRINPKVIDAIQNFLGKIINLHLFQREINEQDIQSPQVSMIVNFRLPIWDPDLVSNQFELNNSRPETFIRLINKLPLDKLDNDICEKDKMLLSLWFDLNVFPPGRALEPVKDPLADLYSFLDLKDQEYLEETSAFISNFRSKINNYYTVSSRIIDTSEQFIRQMTFIGLEDENEQSVSYNAMLKNVLKMNTIEYLDEIGSKEDQITAIYYIICKVVSQYKEIREVVNLKQINEAIFNFNGADFKPIVLLLPISLCEKIRDSIEGLCKNPETCRETCGEEIVEVLDLLDIQIPGGQVLGLGRGERLIDPINKTIIKNINLYLDELNQMPYEDLQLNTGEKNRYIKKKLNEIDKNDRPTLKKTIEDLIQTNGDTRYKEYSKFLELLSNVETLKSDTRSVARGLFRQGSIMSAVGDSQPESDFSQSDSEWETTSPNRNTTAELMKSISNAPVKGNDTKSEDVLKLDQRLISSEFTPFKNNPTLNKGGGTKIIQKGGIAFPFSSAYFTLPEQIPPETCQADCSRYYNANGSKKPNIDSLFQYDLITIVLQILLYADSMHDFKGELNKIRKDVLVNNIFDAFNRLYNIINKPGVNDYNTIRKCIECLKPEIANMLNNFKSKASEEWGGYESVIAYRYTQDIGLSELTILKYIYINPNDLDDSSNFFDKETLIQLGKEGFIFCSSTSTPGDTKVELQGNWYNFFVLMNVDGSPVMPTPVDQDTIKRTMRAYEDNPISKDILAYLFGIAEIPDISDHNGLSYKMIPKDSEDYMSKLLKDDVSNESISGNSDPSNQAQSIVYDSLNNTRTSDTIPDVDDERLKTPENAVKRHPNELLISSMQTFLDVYASANRIQITELTKIDSETDPSKYIGVQIKTTKENAVHPYKLLLTSTSIDSIQGIVAKLFNDKTIVYGSTLTMNDPAIAALNATLNPLQREIMNLAIMYYNNMDSKFKVGSSDDRKNIFMSCVLMWKAFGDYWEVTYVYGLDYMNPGDSNKYLITSTDKNVALMKLWLGLFGIIAKTSIHLPEAYEAVSVTKDTSDQVSLDVDEENFIKKQMGEGMILNVLPKSKDEFLNIKKLKADLMSIADRWDIIQKSEANPMEQGESNDGDRRKRGLKLNPASSPSAQSAPINPIQENIDNIRKIKEKYKPIEQDSSIAAFISLAQNGSLGSVIQTQLIPFIFGELIKNIDSKNKLQENSATVQNSLEKAQEFDRKCFDVLDSDNLKEESLKSQIEDILGRRKEANKKIITDCEAKIKSNVDEIERLSQSLVDLGEPAENATKTEIKTYEKDKQKLEYEIFKLERNTKSNQTKIDDNSETVSKIQKILQKINDPSKKLLPDDINQIKAITRKEMRDNNLLKKQAEYIRSNAEFINSQNEIERLGAVAKSIKEPYDIKQFINDQKISPNIQGAIQSAIGLAPQQQQQQPVILPVMIQKVMSILGDEKMKGDGIIDAFNAIRTLLDIKEIQTGFLRSLGQTAPFASVDKLNRYFESQSMEQEGVAVDSEKEKENLNQILGNSYQEVKKIPFILDFNPAVMAILPSKTISGIQTMSSDLNESYYNKMKKEILAEGYDESSVVTQNKILMLEINHQLFLKKCDLLRSEYDWVSTNFGPGQGQRLDLGPGLDLFKYTIPLKEFNDQMTVAGFQCVSLLADLQETIDFNKTKSEKHAGKISELNSIARQKDEFLTNFKNGNFTSPAKINDAAGKLLNEILELVKPYEDSRSKPFKLPLRNVYNDLKTKYGQGDLRIDPSGFDINWFINTLNYFITKGGHANSEDYKAICYLLSNFSIAKKADAEVVQTKINALLTALDKITVGANLTILNKELYDAFTDLVNVDDSDLQEIFSSEQNTGVRKQKFLKQIQEFKDDADNKKELQRQKEAADAAKELAKQERELAKQQKAAEKAAKEAAKSKGLLSKIGSAVKKGVTTVTTVISDKITSVTDKIEAAVSGKPKKEVDYDLVTKAQQGSLKELVGPIVKALMPFQKRSPTATAQYFATASNKIESNLTSYRENYINKMDNCLKELLMSSNISAPILAASVLGGRKTKRNQKHKYTKKLKHDKLKKKKYTHHTKIKVSKRFTKKYKNNQKAKKKRNTKRGHSSLPSTSMSH